MRWWSRTSRCAQAFEGEIFVSHDPQSPSDAADFENDDALCEGCGGFIIDTNVEAWETFGKLFCEECADGAFEEMGDEE